MGLRRRLGPDERMLAFSSERFGRTAVFLKNLVTGKEETLVRRDERVVVDAWPPDGQFVIVRTVGRAVFLVRLNDDGTPRMLVDPPYSEDEMHVSPDGHWVAFNSDEQRVLRSHPERLARPSYPRASR